MHPVLLFLGSAAATAASIKKGGSGNGMAGGAGCTLSGSDSRIEFFEKSGRFTYFPAGTAGAGEFVTFSLNAFEELNAAGRRISNRALKSLSSSNFQIFCNTEAAAVCPLNSLGQPVGHSVTTVASFTSAGSPVQLELKFCLFTEELAVCTSVDPQTPYTGTPEECAALTPDEAEGMGLIVTRYQVVPDSFAFDMKVSNWPQPLAGGSLELELAVQHSDGTRKRAEMVKKTVTIAEGAETTAVVKRNGNGRLTHNAVVDIGLFTVESPDTFSCGGTPGAASSSLVSNGRALRFHFETPAAGCGPAANVDIYYDPYVSAPVVHRAHAAAHGETAQHAPQLHNAGALAAVSAAASLAAAAFAL